MMNLGNFTLKSQETIQQAQQMAMSKDHQAIETGHLLQAVLNVDESVTPYILKKLNINSSVLNLALDKIIEGYPKVPGASQYLSQRANKVLIKANEYAKAFKDDFVSIEHLLLGLLAADDTISQLMKDSGFTESALKTVIKELRKGEKVTSASAEETYNALDKYAINLLEMARQGKLDPVIGRDDEIRRVLQILSRRTKNNPVLVGEPGVGKTAIAEGLAHRIINGDVPENLKSKVIYSLDMGSLIAGAKYKGEFEERLKAVVKEVVNSDGQVMLFIDEIHTLVGAGAGEGAMDAANILKPSLARGELRAIGATTLNEYQKYIEKDKALERRFQKVMVDEPDRDSAVAILRGIKEKYETHHKVRIKDEAIIAAVDLSIRYITDRHLPDKAIDLIDEAAAKMRLEIDSKPQELDKIERKIMQLEIEREAIKREKDEKKLAGISEDLANLNEQRNAIKGRWEREKELVDGIQGTKENMERLKFEAERAEREGDFGKVAEIRYGKMKEAEQALEDFKKQLEEMETGGIRLIKEEVDAEDVASVVSRWTGIPVTRMLQTEAEKLLQLEDKLHERVVGQEEAIHAVADAVRRSRAGFAAENRPIGSFIFLGTTGVGKTELAKTLAEFLFDDENMMTRIDMSEYQERHSVSRLIGAPPGYIGYEEGGQLTEAVRRKPYSVILLDEIEKAHPDVFNILLQVLEDGRLTDNKGRLANFRNSIIIMTSNLGSEIIRGNFERMDQAGVEKVFEKTKAEVLNLLRSSMRPEFLNRVDEVIMFKPLTHQEIKEIVKLQFMQVEQMVSKQEIRLKPTEEALEYIADAGFDPQFGARPVRRIIQKEVLNELSRALLAGDVKPNADIVLDVFDGKFVFRKPIKETEKAE